MTTLREIFEFIKKYFSVIPLIIVNIIPLICVLFYNWNLYLIIILYWQEAMVIGFFDVLKILFANKKDKRGIYLVETEYWLFSYNFKNEYEIIEEHKPKYKIILNFILICGYVYLFFGFFLAMFLSIHPSLFIITINLPIIFFALSHGISFLYNYIYRKEYQQISPIRQVYKSNERFWPMFALVNVGAWIFRFLGSPLFFLILLIIIKIIVDLFSHLNEHFAKKETITYKEALHERGL